MTTDHQNCDRAPIGRRSPPKRGPYFMPIYSHIMRMAYYLLEDWPHRFLAMCRDIGITPQALHRWEPNLPYPLARIVEWGEGWRFPTLPKLSQSSLQMEHVNFRNTDSAASQAVGCTALQGSPEKFSRNLAPPYAAIHFGCGAQSMGSGLPVRKIRESHNCVTGRVARTGSRRHIDVESTLERDFVVLLSLDEAVISVEEQPLTIRYRFRTGHQRRYTPDFLVHRRGSPPVLIEVKREEALQLQAKELAAKFDAARQHCASVGWRFEVWTEREIRTPRLENARFLRGYQSRRLDAGACARLLRILAMAPGATASEILGAIAADTRDRASLLACLWSLVAQRRIAADLDSPLTMNSLLHLPGGQ